MNPKTKTLIALILSHLCTFAGALAVQLPPGGFQQGAAVAADMCQAAGLPTGPVFHVPASPPAKAPSTPAAPNSPALPSPAPLVPPPEWLNGYVRHASAPVDARPWVRLGAERWRGEARGWALA